uniref:Titin (Trinotate prediction) n=1 Tax=Henneguya salminicola TaxID=69463 RepID=A0A6G3MDU5_HENSL
MDLKKSSKIVVVTENRKIITLRCVVNGYPYADIKFVKQNLTFTPNSVSVSQKNIDRLEALLKLTIESQSQVGNYTCIATNTLGTSTLDIMVKYMDIPLPPRNVHILELDTTSVRIGWDISASQALRDTYSFLATIWDNNHVFTQSIQIFEEYAIFTALTRGKKYYFSVRASNIAGWSLPSNTIIFNTPNVGRPSAPLVLNRQIFLPTSDFRLYWTGPMDNGGDSIITYTVRKCIWNIERITFDMDCETFRGVRSNEIYFNGLIAFQLYDFYVSAVNSIQNSEEARFQVFSGPNSFIGTPGGTSPEVITILILLFTILFILLMDILLFLCLRTGVLYWLITCCLFKKSRIEEEQIPLRRDSMGPIKTITETVPMNTEFSKIYQKDTERIENNNYLEVEDHMYQEICEDNVRKYNPIIISNERQKTLENKNSPENVQYSIAEDRQKSDRENYNMGFPLNKAALSENRNTQGNRYNKESSMNINTYDRDKGGEKIRLLQGEERGGKTNLKPSKYSNTISTKNNAEEIKFGERDYPVRTFTLTPEELQNKAKILTKNINIPSNEGKGTIVNFDSMSKKNLPKITRQTNLE